MSESVSRRHPILALAFDERGQDLVEYVLLAALLAVALVGAISAVAAGLLQPMYRALSDAVAGSAS
jgi:Flp pilus assembly pilin Flp